MSTPEFGQGSPERRGSRRLAIGIGAFVVAVIAVVAIVAILS